MLLRRNSIKLAYNMKISEFILNIKDRPIVFVSPNDPVIRAVELLAEFDLGCLLVIENGKIEGIFSEQDYARKIILKGLSSRITPVSQAMTKKVHYVTPDYDLKTSLAIMAMNKINNLPVIENNQLVAFFSMQEAAAALIKEKDFMINELTKYITGSQFHGTSHEGDYLYQAQNL